MSRQPEAASPAAGRGLIGLVLVLGILGALGAVVLVMGGSGGRDLPTGTALPTLKSPSHSGAAILSDAANVVCKADYAAVSAAVSDYETLNGKPPASMAALGSILKDPGSSSRFSIIINPNSPGQVEVAAGGHPAQPGDRACAFAG
jgi:hypothetical protein